MLPSLGFQEILVIGILALVIIGPKDLPLMLRKLGRWTARLRGMAQEFRTGFDELARQAELDELKREVEALRATTNLNSLANEISRPLPTLEDYAGVNKAVAGDPVQHPSPQRGEGREGGRAGNGASGDTAVPPASPLPLPPPPGAGEAASLRDDSSLVEGERLDQPLARSAP